MGTDGGGIAVRGIGDQLAAALLLAVDIEVCTGVRRHRDALVRRHGDTVAKDQMHRSAAVNAHIFLERHVLFDHVPAVAPRGDVGGDLRIRPAEVFPGGRHKVVVIQRALDVGGDGRGLHVPGSGVGVDGRIGPGVAVIGGRQHHAVQCEGAVAAGAISPADTHSAGASAGGGDGAAGDGDLAAAAVFAAADAGAVIAGGGGDGAAGDGDIAAGAVIAAADAAADAGAVRAAGGGDGAAGDGDSAAGAVIAAADAGAVTAAAGRHIAAVDGDGAAVA